MIHVRLRSPNIACLVHAHHYFDKFKMTENMDGPKKSRESKRRMTTIPLGLSKYVPRTSNEVFCSMHSCSRAAESTSGIQEISNEVVDSEGLHEGQMANLVVPKSNISKNASGEIPNEGFKEDFKKEVNAGTSALTFGSYCFSISIEVGSLMHFVKGKHGFMQRQIEEDTGVKIIFPSSKEDTCIVIEGASMDCVSKAGEKIRQILEEAVKSPRLDYSHFVSLPLAIHGELVEKLIMFQNSVLGETVPQEAVDSGSSSDEDCSHNDDKKESRKHEAKIAVDLKISDKDFSKKIMDKGQQVKVELGESSACNSSLSELGIERSIFIKPKTMHLTVVMLKLYNKERLALAAEVLQKISSRVQDALGNRPIFIRLKGLACMRGSPKKAQVVYAPVEEIGGEGRLSHACRVIINAYLEAGLVPKEDAKQTLKLHATLMNVRHRKRGKKKVQKFDSFDARAIFEKYGSEDWGEYRIREAHLSQRFKYDTDGYYHCCTSIPFPEQVHVE